MGTNVNMKWYFLIPRPILGYSTSKSNVYKETEELAKVCHAKFGDRKTLLYHPFIRIYIHEKWEKVKWFFHIFRLFHVSLVKKDFTLI